MTLTKTTIDGQEVYQWSGEPGGGVMQTGPVAGTVTLKDGTVYDVTPKIIEFAPGHAGPLHHHIERMHQFSEALNVPPTPDRPEGYTVVHVCSERCGAEAIPPTA
jgi:hypothetical protein